MSLPILPRDVLFVIIKEVDDPVTYQRCSMLNKMCKDFCDKIKGMKMNQFAKLSGTYWQPKISFEQLDDKTKRNLFRLYGRKEATAVICHMLPDGTLHGRSVIWETNMLSGVLPLEVTFVKGYTQGPFRLMRRFSSGAETLETGSFIDGELHGEIKAQYEIYPMGNGIQRRYDQVCYHYSHGEQIAQRGRDSYTEEWTDIENKMCLTPMIVAFISDTQRVWMWK